MVLNPAKDEFEDKLSKVVVKAVRYLPRMGSVAGG